MDDFNIGDEVAVFAPEEYEDRFDRDLFGCGWAEGDMDEHIGQTGVIIDEGYFEGFKAYKIRFFNGDIWWWDVRYMVSCVEPPEPTIPAEDFNAILI